MSNSDKKSNKDISNNSEKRQESRLAVQETLFLELSLPNESDQAPKMIVCNTVDISANGLQVSMDHTLPAGSIHQLGIELENPPQRFHLVAEVKWCRPRESSGYLVGFALYESDDTDIEAWKTAMAERFG
jgi:hypothetical protein